MCIDFRIIQVNRPGLLAHDRFPVAIPLMKLKFQYAPAADYESVGVGQLDGHIDDRRAIVPHSNV
jgi:hypothetical protein